MSVFNLGVVFGPTLLRPREESVAAILDIKFNNIVINILIDNYERIFKNKPSADIKLPDATKAPSIMYPSRSSPPTRMPRASQIGKAASTGAMGSSSNTAGNPMFLNQQKIYRVVSNTNCTEPTMSSSLQNIPNGDNYALGSNAMNSSGGAQCISLSPPMHMLNGILADHW